ncbi:MAG: CTP-dependent riboflavin kinase [Candidatus Bathyarchaeota archaeon]|nr:MAG: CTP-dependent riboflavin kinase [Candidatus Bathyarchaeota archaeon]
MSGCPVHACKVIGTRTVTVEGRVFSGEGTGTLFVNLPWAKKQFENKLKFSPYPGTLNLRVSSETAIEALKDTTRGIRIEASEGFYSGRCFEAVVSDRVCGAVVVPDVPGYPSDVLEILAPVNLREELGLEDGMEVVLTIWLE